MYQGVRHQILTLELAPNALLSEVGLAQEFGVSPTPVRDALSRLSQEGLVTVASRRGYRVAPLSLENIVDIGNLRYILESGAIRLIVERDLTGGVPGLRGLAANTSDPDATGLELIERNAAFHLGLAGLTGNKRLVEALARVLDASTRVFHLGLGAFHPLGMRQGHDSLLDAVERKDLARALELCGSEVYGTTQRVVNTLLEGAPRAFAAVEAASSSHLPGPRGAMADIAAAHDPARRNRTGDCLQAVPKTKSQLTAVHVPSPSATRVADHHTTSGPVPQPR